MKECKTIAICNQKGGVGKTTTALNLGVGMTRHGKRVLLVDLDPQADLTTCLGWPNYDSLETTITKKLYEVIQQDKQSFDFDVNSNENMDTSNTQLNPLEGILHHKEGVDLMPADSDLESLNSYLEPEFGRESKLRKYLDSVKDRYDFIIIDCKPSIDLLTINALSAADTVIIPVQAQYLPAKGMTQLFRSIYMVRRDINPNLKIDGILLTLVDVRTNLAKSTADAIRNSYGNVVKMYKNYIPIGIKAAEVTSKGKSIYDYDPNGKVAQAYNYFTKEVLNDGKKKERLQSSLDR